MNHVESAETPEAVAGRRWVRYVHDTRLPLMSADGFGRLGNPMLTVCWAVKGGSGTSTVSALLAVNAHRPTTLVDLDGDLPLILGVPPRGHPGIDEWAASATPAEHLDDLLVEVVPGLHLLTARSSTTRPSGPIPSDRRADLVDWCAARGRSGHDVIVDAGTGPLDGHHHDAADRTVLVTRNCYIALQRAPAITRRPTTVVLIREAAIGLGRADVEAAVGATVGAELAVEPGIARTVNAGLLTARARGLSLPGDTTQSRRPWRRRSATHEGPADDAVVAADDVA